jgi:hypothetical protein
MAGLDQLSVPMKNLSRGMDTSNTSLREAIGGGYRTSSGGALSPSNDSRGGSDLPAMATT